VIWISNTKIYAFHISWQKVIYDSFVLIFVFLFANSISAQETQEIKILNVNTMKFNKAQGRNMQRLLGAVRIQHKNTFLNCDSAHLYRDSNMVKAYSRVFIRQGDSLKIYGDFLEYRGNSNKAKLRKHVKMVDKESILETDYLDYDMKLKVGYYSRYGQVENENNIVSSKQGVYYSDDNLFYFKDSVRVVSPDYTISCDTMSYQTVKKVTYFFGPTEIISDSNYIYCEHGWYDTQLDRSLFSGNGILKTKSQSIKGDTLYYDKVSGKGWGRGRVRIIDSVQNVILSGNRGTFQNKPEKTMMTDSALFIQITEGGDSLYLHADTLRSRLDSTGEHKVVNAYFHVRIFEKNLQGYCDSLSYSFADSIIHFFGSPCLWSDENQLTADQMNLFTKNKGADRLDLQGSAFIVSQEDSGYFNQIKGKNMVGFFRNNELYKINVSGNGQTIYFPSDQGKIIGVNYVESSDIILTIDQKKIKKINMINQPQGTLDPKNKMNEAKIKLEGFQWLVIRRPTSVKDLFRK